MSFRRLHLSFTERRRHRLAKKVDRLDRLESRTTITEPISFTGLAISALSPLVQLGFITRSDATGAISPITRCQRNRKKAGDASPKPYAIPANLLKSIDALALGRSLARARRERHQARVRPPTTTAAIPRTIGSP